MLGASCFAWMQDDADWAREHFGQADLGDERRVARLVSVARQAARHPAGRVTQVCKSSADREGAFRLLENAAVSAEAVAEASFSSTARACAGRPCVYVALDGSSLTLTDRTKRRELGKVGTCWPTRGLHVMSALGVDAKGATIGLLAQRWWIQPDKAAKKPRFNSHLEKETRHWLDALNEVSGRLAEQASDVTPWFQLDRGADCWPVLAHATEQNLLLTVRASHDRRLEDVRGRHVYLRQTLRKQLILGHYQLQVPARRDRAARSARIALRACKVVISARISWDRRRSIAINAVFAEEIGHQGKDRISWFLLTTAPVDTFEQARAVVRGYSLRWRVEEFHRAWKRGLCNVEDTQLQSRSAIVKWATILAAVAARALRIAQLLRTTPDIPASDEFTNYEIAATYAISKKKWDRRRRPSFREIVDIIADLGGFANKYSGGRPGPTVLGRGLAHVQAVAEALKNIDEMR
jgi:hypothetical protein